MELEKLDNIKSLIYENKKITASESHVNVYEDDKLIEQIVTSEPKRFLREKACELERSEPLIIVISCKLGVKHGN